MVDSTGAAITMTVATNFSEGRAVSPSSFGYHWNHNGESQYLNGTAMGAKMLEILAP